MKQIENEQLKQVNGGWLHIAFAVARIGWAFYRHSSKANAASWAARGASIVGGTYSVAKGLDPNQ